MAQKQNSYFLTDKDLDDIAKKVVSELYSNKDILELKNNGRTLNGGLNALVSRSISGIYSNIDNNKPLQTVLTNSIRYSILTDKNTAQETEFKKIREACERRKNMLMVLNRKLELDETETLKNDIDKTTEEISLLESQLNDIASKNSEQPCVKKNILELAKKAYNILLRSDKTSEKFYVAICKYMEIKVTPEHFGYDVYRNYSEFKPYYVRNDNNEEKKDIYVPPALQNNSGYRRRNNYGRQ